jgi:hypothetical protein
MTEMTETADYNERGEHRVRVDEPSGWIARRHDGRWWVADTWIVSETIPEHYHAFGRGDDGQYYNVSVGAAYVAVLPGDTPAEEVFDRADAIQRELDDNAL